MKETEITVEVFDDIESIDDVLKSQGYEICRVFDLFDYYYSKYSTQELKLMTYNEMIANSFLVRNIVCGDGQKVLLTYKNKEFDKNNNVISEEKVNCNIDNVDNALRLFDLAGLNMWNKMLQHISVYKKGDIEFAVQHINGLGTFIEYEEDDTMSNLKTPDEKIEYMLNILRGVGLKIGEDFSCKKVYMKFKKENGLN